MNQKIKIIIILLIIGTLAYLGYRYLTESTPKEVEDTQEAQLKESYRKTVIEEMAKKYDALVDWNKNIHYTIQLQDLLVNSDRPVLFTGSVDDIFMEGEQHYVRFRSGGLWSFEFFGSQVYFVLKCDAEKASEIINKEIEIREMIKNEDNLTDLDLYDLILSDNYVVVAKIEDVTKPILQISAYPIGQEEVELEYKPSDTFIATGTCIDFVYIGNETKQTLEE